MNTFSSPLNLLLADDDDDDRLFFAMTLNKLNITTHLETVSDGEKLMKYLSTTPILPDIIFLDLNMPLKNGIECLSEIKGNNKFINLPVIIYSTSLHDDVAQKLYKLGAHYYIRKTDLTELFIDINKILSKVVERKIPRPTMDKFIISNHAGAYF